MTIRDNIVHALPAALLVAVLCAVTLPAVVSTAWVVGGSILAFAAVVGIFLYLQGSFSSHKKTNP